jgi:hypothetical protein
MEVSLYTKEYISKKLYLKCMVFEKTIKPVGLFMEGMVQIWSLNSVDKICSRNDINSEDYNVCGRTLESYQEGFSL